MSIIFHNYFFIKNSMNNNKGFIFIEGNLDNLKNSHANKDDNRVKSK